MVMIVPKINDILKTGELRNLSLCLLVLAVLLIEVVYMPNVYLYCLLFPLVYVNTML